LTLDASNTAIDAALSRVTTCLQSIRSTRVGGEREHLHALVREAIRGQGLPCFHEHKLTDVLRSRVDFLAVCNGHGVAVELKQKRPHAERLVSQVLRYMGSRYVDAVLVVVERGFPFTVPDAPKPYRLLALNANWGVAV
jgi:hypothetical protein